MYLADLFYSNCQTQENLPSRLPFRIRLCVYGQIITMVNTDRGWSWTQPCQVYLWCNNTVWRKVLTGSCSKKCLFHGANNQLRWHFLHYFFKQWKSGHSSSYISYAERLNTQGRYWRKRTFSKTAWETVHKQHLRHDSNYQFCPLLMLRLISTGSVLWTD